MNNFNFTKYSIELCSLLGLGCLAHCLHQHQHPHGLLWAMALASSRHRFGSSIVLFIWSSGTSKAALSLRLVMSPPGNAVSPFRILVLASIQC